MYMYHYLSIKRQAVDMYIHTNIQHRLKYWTRRSTFAFVLMPLGKALTHLFSTL